jgi:hypothetical protein
MLLLKRLIISHSVYIAKVREGREIQHHIIVAMGFPLNLMKICTNKISKIFKNKQEKNGKGKIKLGLHREIENICLKLSKGKINREKEQVLMKAKGGELKRLQIQKIVLKKWDSISLRSCFIKDKSI